MTQDARPGPTGLDLAALRDHLETELPGFTDGPLRGELIEGGRSNLTYLVSDDTQRWVVRRPPLGHVLATAHDMAREYRVLTALTDTAVPVPLSQLLCVDETVLGAPFYVMDWVPGATYRTAEQVDTLSVDKRHALADELIDVLAALHTIDPASVDLADFGRPDGFLDRQVRRWTKQLAASRSREIEGIDALASGLAETVPASGAPGIVHGDYRLDNVLVGDGATINAVLDWEMATLGDPLTDLGLLIVYWEGFEEIANNPIAQGVGPHNGFPPASELLRRYAERTGRTLSNMDWYVALGYFKIAVILEGIHYRFQHEQTVGSGFEHIGALVPPLIRQGLDALHRR